MKLHMPTWLTILLAVSAGILEGLNVTVFGLPAQAQQWVTVGLATLAAVGISPLTGTPLQTVLHLTHSTVLAIGGLMSAIVVAVSTISMDQTVKGAITGAVTLLAGVLLGTSPAETGGKITSVVRKVARAIAKPVSTATIPADVQPKAVK